MLIGFDCETNSNLDVTEVGPFKYSQDPSTDVLMFWFIWKVKGVIKSFYWSPFDGSTKSIHLEKGAVLLAHNRWFEFCIWNNILVPRYGFSPITESQIIDSQDQALACALPKSLKLACQYTKIDRQKDPEGKRLIQLFCRDQANPLDHPKDWILFKHYCKNDVFATLALHYFLPKLTLRQQAVSDLTLRMNWRGVSIDEYGVKAALKLTESIKAEGNDRIHEMTSGLVERGTQRERVKDWLADTQGLQLDNMKAGTVVAALDGKMTKLAREMLLLYQICGRSSTAKLIKIQEYLCRDGRIHELLIWHGAITGRWTATGVQFQNFPRPVLPTGTDYRLVVKAIKTLDLKQFKKFCDEVAFFSDDWKANPMQAIVSSLRSLIVAEINKIFYAADYSAIEARIAVWLAGEQWAVDAYFAGEDAYKTMAADTLKIDVDDVNGDQRFMGKQQILSCQFQTSWKGLKRMLKETYNVNISAKEAKRLVKAYRDKYPAVVAAWWAFQDAAEQAIKHPGKRYKATTNPTVTFYRESKFLFCELPSGRRIAYPYPRLKKVLRKWDKELEEFRLPRKGDTRLTWLSQITFLKQVEHKWIRGETYGGSMFQGAVQGIGADYMGDGLLNVEKLGYPPILSIHDEGLTEVDENFGDLDEFEAGLCESEAWAEGLPVAAEGWTGPVNKK